MKRYMKCLLMGFYWYSLPLANGQITPGRFIKEHDTVSVAINWTTTSGIDIKNSIVNTDVNPIVFSWKMINPVPLSLHNGWSVSTFCDNLICYSNKASWYTKGDEYVAGAILPTEKAILKLNMIAPYSSDDGETFISFQVRTTTQIDTIVFHVKKINNTSIKESSQANSLAIFPNPANANLNLFLNNIQNIKAVIYNVSGETILNQTFIQVKEAVVNLNGIATGRYIIKVVDFNGKVLGVKQFYKQ